MKILFVCDMNSVHSQKWVEYFIQNGHAVHIYSTTPFRPEFVGAPVYAKRPAPLSASGKDNPSPARLGFRLAPATAKLAERIFVLWKTMKLRFQTYGHAKAISGIVSTVKPDVIHCLRIPNEGFAGASLKSGIPFAVSTWGNDLTYWAKKIILKTLTRRTLQKAQLLFSDCRRDVMLSKMNGYDEGKDYLVLPGSGGMLPADLESGERSLEHRGDFFAGLFPSHVAPIFLSLRGFGSQDIDNVPLLRACKLLVTMGIEFRLVIAGKREGFRYRKLSSLLGELKLSDHVSLIGTLSHEDAMDSLRSADFSISISHNDGTPNSMLEAMTFGAIPLMSDIESIREWIVDGRNGYLFDPFDPKTIAEAMRRAISEKGKHPSMRIFNHKLVSDRADYLKNMEEAERALLKLIRGKDV